MKGQITDEEKIFTISITYKGNNKTNNLVKSGQKIWTHHKKRWSHANDQQSSMSINMGKWKLKPQCDAT